ncbi:MAG: aconitase family protein [Streptococcus salivarius]
MDKIFKDAGFEWKWMLNVSWNESDKVPDGVHCASTSNRNFEDRQGFGANTPL